MPRICPTCCVTTCGSICIIVGNSCFVSGNPGYAVPGATVAVTGPGTITGSPCTATGLVTSVTRPTGGSGYTSVPTVTIAAPVSGTTATATAVMPATSLTTLTKTASGSGYTGTPTATFSYGNAAAQVRLVATTVASIAVVNGGTGYGTPTVTVSSGGGTGATATATVVGGVVTAINVTAPGSGFTFTPTVAITGGGGSGATATATLTASTVNLVQFTSVGSNYSLVTGAPTVTISGGGGSGATATVALTGVSVTSYTVTNAGTGYTTTPTATVTGGGGSGATATVVMTVSCCVQFTIAGTYSVTVTPPAGVDLAARTVSVVATCANTTATVNMLPATGYACARSQCCTTADQPGSVPYYDAYSHVPSVLYINDGLGTVTLNEYTGSVPAGTRIWYGTSTRTSSQTYSNCVTGIAGSATVPVAFSLQCPGGGGVPKPWTLVLLGANGCSTAVYPSTGTVSYPSPYNVAPLFTATNGVTSSPGTAVAIGGSNYLEPTCLPFSLSATHDFGFGAGFVYPAAISFTVSE